MRKTCDTCGVEKDIADFKLVRRNGKEWRMRACKTCFAARRAAWHRTHRAGDRQRKKAWYAKHPECPARYYQRRRSTLQGYLVHCAKRKRGACRRAGIACDIPDDGLIGLYEHQGGKCAITGRALQWEGKLGADTLSIDRIDSARGYTMNNIRLVTFQANTARARWRDRELFAFAHDVMATVSRSPHADGTVTQARINFAYIHRFLAEQLRGTGVRHVRITRQVEPIHGDTVDVVLEGGSMRTAPPPVPQNADSEDPDDSSSQDDQGPDKA